MGPDAVSRRSFLARTGGAAVSAWLALDLSAMEAAAAQGAGGAATAGGYRVLSAAEAAALEAFADRIFPRDATPGAREIGAVRFIDLAFATHGKDLRPPIQSLIAALDAEAARRRRGATFASLPAAAQDAAMRAVEAASPEAFGAGRTAVLAGVFANPSYGGNRDKQGWALLGFQDAGAWAPPYGWYDRDAHRR